MRAALGRVAIAAACFALIVSAPAAAFTPKVGLDTTGRGASITVNGRCAVRFQASNGALSATERATVTSERLRQLAGKIDPRSIFAKGTKWQASVYAGDTLICVATRLDARANHTMPLPLANTWAISNCVYSLATNANPITIKFGAANPYNLLGASWQIVLAPGQEAQSYLKDGAPAIGSGAKNIDLSGTGAQALQCQVVLG